MRECQEAIRQSCFPSFTGRSQSGWRYLPFTIDGVPVLKVIPDEFDNSEDEEFYNAARRHRFDQLMTSTDTILEFRRPSRRQRRGARDLALALAPLRHARHGHALVHF